MALSLLPVWIAEIGEYWDYFSVDRFWIGFSPGTEMAMLKAWFCGLCAMVLGFCGCVLDVCPTGRSIRVPVGRPWWRQTYFHLKSPTKSPESRMSCKFRRPVELKQSHITTDAPSHLTVGIRFFPEKPTLGIRSQIADHIPALSSKLQVLTFVLIMKKCILLACFPNSLLARMWFLSTDLVATEGF